jgi:hypothetical protein
MSDKMSYTERVKYNARHRDMVEMRQNEIAIESETADVLEAERIEILAKEAAEREVQASIQEEKRLIRLRRHKELTDMWTSIRNLPLGTVPTKEQQAYINKKREIENQKNALLASQRALPVSNKYGALEDMHDDANPIISCDNDNNNDINDDESIIEAMLASIENEETDK